MVLTPNQKKAIKVFDKYGYLVLVGPRMCGKSEILKAIIRKNPTKKIGVKCLSRHYYRDNYSQFRNCFYVSSVREVGIEDVDILIGDEILIEPRNDIQTACALTQKYIVTRIISDLPNCPTKKILSVLRKELGEEDYMVNYGQYIKED